MIHADGWLRRVSLDDSGCGQGWLLIVLCRFSAVVSCWQVPGGWRCCPMCSGGTGLTRAGAVSFPGSQGRFALVRRVRAGRTAAASRW